MSWHILKARFAHDFLKALLTPPFLNVGGPLVRDLDGDEVFLEMPCLADKTLIQSWNFSHDLALLRRKNRAYTPPLSGRFLSLFVSGWSPSDTGVIEITAP
jgi:hypothetical protein